MQMNSRGYCFVSLYQSYPSYHGASDLTLNTFNCWPNKNKILFQITKLNIKKKNIININHKPGFIGNIYNIFLITFKIKKYLKKYPKKFLIIEGASWIGYIFFLTILCNIFIKNLAIIYHAHNLEYEVRKLKNNSFISLLSFYIEKFIYQKYFSTCVSKKDYRFILKKYKTKSYLFENGIVDFKPKSIKKIKLKKKKFILFCGSYSYWPNKIAVDLIIKKKEIFEKIYPEILFVFTGEGMPKFKYKNYMNLGIVKKNNLIWLYKNCLMFYSPLPKAPGTKMKIIEAIYYNSIVVCSKFSLIGLKKIDKIKTIHIQNQKNLLYLLKKIKISYNKNKISDLKIFRKHYDLKINTVKLYEKINKII